jgi:hypothetical protein
MVFVVNKDHDGLHSKKNVLEIVCSHLQEYEHRSVHIGALTEQEAKGFVLVVVRLLDESTSK